MSEVRHFIFTVSLGGDGATEQEAWQNAVLNFSLDPGKPETTIDEEKWLEEYDRTMASGRINGNS